MLLLLANDCHFLLERRARLNAAQRRPQRRAGLDTFGYGGMNGIEAFCPSGFQTASSTAFYWSGMVEAIANGQAPVLWERELGRNLTDIL